MRLLWLVVARRWSRWSVMFFCLITEIGGGDRMDLSLPRGIVLASVMTPSTARLFVVLFYACGAWGEKGLSQLPFQGHKEVVISRYLV